MESLHDSHHELPSTATQHVDSYYDRTYRSDGQKDAGKDGQGGRNLVGLHTVHGDLNFLYGQAVSLEAREIIGSFESNMVISNDFV